MSQNAKRYTSVSKGGEYEVVGTSAGAGQRKGDVVIVYRDTGTGQIHHREPEDFAMRMKVITKPEINTQLLAALEAVLPLAKEAGNPGTPEIIAAIDAIAAAKGSV